MKLSTLLSHSSTPRLRLTAPPAGSSLATGRADTFARVAGPGLESMRLFAVVDRLAEQFQVGMLPTSRGAAGEGLYGEESEESPRSSESERRSLYARVLADED